MFSDPYRSLFYLHVVSFSQMHEFFNPKGLDGERAGIRGGVMEGDRLPWSHSSPSLIVDSPTDVIILCFFHRLGAVYQNMDRLIRP